MGRRPRDWARIGRAADEAKPSAIATSNDESEGTTGGELRTHGPPSGPCRGTSQPREPDAYARRDIDGASFSGNPACVGSASTLPPPSYQSSGKRPLDGTKTASHSPNGAGTITSASRIIHVSARISDGGSWCRDRVQDRAPRRRPLSRRHPNPSKVVRRTGHRAFPAGAITPLRDRAHPLCCVRNPPARDDGGPAPGYACVLCVRTPSPLVRGQTCEARRSPDHDPRRTHAQVGRHRPSRPGVLVGLSAPLAGGQDVGPVAEIPAPSDGIPTSWPTDWQSLGSAPDTLFARTTSARRRDVRHVDGNGPGSSARMGATSRRRWGSASNNLDSDLFFRQIIDSHVHRPDAGRASAARTGARRPPGRPRIRRGLQRYLSDVGGPSGVPDPRCQGQPWSAHHRGRCVPALLPAHPAGRLRRRDPGDRGSLAAAPGGTTTAFDPQSARAATPRTWSKVRRGSEATPWPWGAPGPTTEPGSCWGTRTSRGHGPERFYQMQLTIPGQVNFTGVGLYGVPAINIGHTATVAWSHHRLAAFRFTPYQLTLVPRRPTFVPPRRAARRRGSAAVSVQALSRTGVPPDRHQDAVVDAVRAGVIRPRPASPA